MSDLTGINLTDCQAPLHPRAIEGLELFNQGKYWRAHEALEAAWREETGPIRELYRGILQAAVVYLHVSQNNYAGAVKVYGRCMRWLKPWPDKCRGVEVELLRQDLDKVIEVVVSLGPDQLAAFDPSLLKPVPYTRT